MGLPILLLSWYFLSQWVMQSIKTTGEATHQESSDQWVSPGHRTEECWANDPVCLQRLINVSLCSLQQMEITVMYSMCSCPWRQLVQNAAMRVLTSMTVQDDTISPRCLSSPQGAYSDIWRHKQLWFLLSQGAPPPILSCPCFEIYHGALLFISSPYRPQAVFKTGPSQWQYPSYRVLLSLCTPPPVTLRLDWHRQLVSFEHQGETLLFHLAFV